MTCNYRGWQSNDADHAVFRISSMGSDVAVTFDYLIGVDGGGTGTRVRIERPDGTLAARGTGGPSGLMHGSSNAWAAILAALDSAFADAALVRPAFSCMAIGLGLA